MERCEQVFRQACWLEERFWPDVDGMGEQDESGGRHGEHAGAGPFGGGGGVQGQGQGQGPGPQGGAQAFAGVLNGVVEAAAAAAAGGSA